MFVIITIIVTKFIIRSQPKNTLIQCWVYVRPPSSTSAQHKPSIGSRYRVCWDVSLDRPNIDPTEQRMLKFGWRTASAGKNSSYLRWPPDAIQRLKAHSKMPVDFSLFVISLSMPCICIRAQMCIPCERPANTRLRAYVVLMLLRRRRRWSNI